MQDSFLTYYNAELDYLRKAGRQFAKQHPAIAKALDFSDSPSKNEDIERLLESFAFLTAQLHQHIDKSNTETAHALYQALYPEMMAPLPAMGIVQFHPHIKRFQEKLLIPKGKEVYTPPIQGTSCRFQTVYPINLTPLQVVHASLVNGKNHGLSHPFYLHLTLSCIPPITTYPLNEITFYLQGAPAKTLYEGLMRSTQSPIYASTNDGESYQTNATLSFQGFDDTETILPLSHSNTHAHILLTEFFHFPEKFLFVKISGLNPLTLSPENTALQLYVPVQGHLLQGKTLEPQNFLLNCTPVVNLFHKITDPVTLDYRHTAYDLIADRRRPGHFEIHTVTAVNAIIDNQTETLPAYFCQKHHENKRPLLWYSNRAASRLFTGSDITLSFVDHSLTPKTIPSRLIYANTLCTNRDLPLQLSANTPLSLDDVYPLSHIAFVTSPTPPCFTPLNGEATWRMISLLAGHTLIHEDGNYTLDHIKERLHLLAIMAQKECDSLIQSLHHITTKPVMRRLATARPVPTFVHGIQLHLTQIIEGSGCNRGDQFLLATILSHYFRLTSHIHSFTELVLHHEEGEWHHYPR